MTNKPPPKVVVEQGTTVTLCCVATGSPRPRVEWTRHQRSTLFSPFFQEDGCLAVNTAKAHGEEDYICRATNSFGLTETVTTVIATGIKTVITFITSTEDLKLIRLFFHYCKSEQENAWQKS